MNTLVTTKQKLLAFKKRCKCDFQGIGVQRPCGLCNMYGHSSSTCGKHMMEYKIASSAAAVCIKLNNPETNLKDGGKFFVTQTEAGTSNQLIWDIIKDTTETPDERMKKVLAIYVEESGKQSIQFDFTATDIMAMISCRRNSIVPKGKPLHFELYFLTIEQQMKLSFIF